MAMLEDHEHKHAYHDFDGLIEIRVNPPPTYFSVLFYGLIIWGVVFCAWYLLSGWSSETEFRQEMAAYQEQMEQQRSAPPPSAEGKAPVAGAAAEAKSGEGQILFSENCAVCHGADGKGGIGPDLTRQEYTYGRAAEEVARSIREGRPNGMPAFGNQFSPAQIDSLVQHVLAL